MSDPQYAEWQSERRSSSTSISSLSLSIDPEDIGKELTRGAPLHVALGGWGRHWRSSQEALFADMSEVSKAVEYFDDFLSHDWRTSRFLKLIALLIFFNSTPAALTSLIVSFAVGLLRICGRLPDELWTVSFSFLSYVGVFCFWQRIRILFSRPFMVFFDKLCINQFDSEAKKQGILGLGAFVMRSKQVLVLWSPEYFNRLWCSFEVACFLSSVYKGKVEFISVNGSYVLFLTSILWHIMMCAFFISVSMLKPSTPHHWIAITIFMSASSASLLVFLNYLGISLAQQVKQLPGQLRNFRVQETQCFCCVNKHQDPGSKQELACDRELVYQTLAQMYGSMPNDPENALESFNHRVRAAVAKKIIRRATLKAPFKHIMSVCVASVVPYLSELMSRLNKGPRDSLSGFDLAVWCTKTIIIWLQPALCILLAYPISIGLWQLVGSVYASLWISPVIVLAIATNWAPIHLVDVLTPQNSMLPFVPFLLVLAVVVLLYSPILDRCKGSGLAESDGPADNEDAGPADLSLEIAPVAAQDPSDDEDGDKLFTWAF
ncbi:unnamed protein product [Effrenium voratum]|uniref:Uncharacterized protein n=1 Tax=Effrenium voratum TaxID=2562239 RepID=A0AA36J7R5_9DINO|nr:unnamed protein product [Effrenium voratum]